MGNLAEGAFSIDTPADLLYGQQYYYRCYATNAGGSDWADSTAGFTVLPSVSAQPGLEVKTFTSPFSEAGHLNPISNLQAETPLGVHMLTGNLDFPDFIDMSNAYPSLPAEAANGVSILWEGSFEADESTYYSFGTESDDGSVVYIDLDGDGDFDNGSVPDAGELIVNNNGPHGDRQVVGSVYLEDGFYSIAIGFYESGGGETMRAGWAKGNGLAWGSQSYINGSSGHFYLEQPTIFSVTNTGVSNVTATSARFNGELESPLAVFDVYAHWGTTDGGADPGAWAHSALVGSYTDVSGPISYTASGLAQNATYYSTLRAVNAATEIWAEPSESFQTGAVSVQATDPTATEGGLDTGEFTFYRPAGSTGEPLLVNYAVSGTAENVADYQALSGIVVIPDGLQTATVAVIPVDDWVASEPGETVRVTVLPGLYPVGSSNTAQVTIADNDVSPSEIAGLQLWLDAGQGVLERIDPDNTAENNDSVVGWRGISTNSHLARQDVAEDQPRYDTDGISQRPSVWFDGDAHMAVGHSTDLDAGNGQTVFVLFSHNSGASPVQKGDGDALEVDEWLVTPSTYSVSGVSPQGLRDPDRGEVRLITGRYTGSQVQVYHNGVFQDEAPCGGSVANLDDLLLGAGTENQLNGRIGEILVYDQSLDDADRSQVEGYLLGKYFGDVVFSNVQIPDRPTTIDTVAVSAEITPLVAGTDVAATLWYRQGTSGGYTPIAMSNTSGNVYRTVTPIPGGSQSTVQYYVQTTYTGTTNGTAYRPYSALSAPASFTRADADSRQVGPSSRLSGLIVSEIMYHPADPDGLGGIDPTDLEFIKICNTEPVPNDLSRYELKGEVDFVFPEGTVLAGRSRLVVASNPVVAESFYGVTGVLGPYENLLSNGGGQIRLHNQLGALLQEVDYTDEPPWPLTPDGLGDSLHRISVDVWGNDPSNWTAAPPDPGPLAGENTPPYVLDEIADVAVAEDDPNTLLDLSTTFADADLGDSLTLTITNNTNSALVQTNLVGTALTLSYLQDQNGTAEITVRATDLLGASVENTFTVTVAPTGDLPSLANPIADIEVDEDSGPHVIDLAATFHDVDVPPDVLTLSVTGNTNSGLVGTNLVGTQLTLSFAAGQDGTAEITVRAEDSDHNRVEDTFTVAVNPVTHPPFVDVPIADVIVDEDAADSVLDLSDTFGDPDMPGDVLSLTVAGNTDPGLVDTDLDGTVLTLSYAPGQHGSADVTIRATDLDGANPAADASDGDAIATDKTALLPGETAGFANYTSFNGGINGIMVDLDDAAGTPDLSDFGFRVGNDDAPGGWIEAAAPAISFRPGVSVGQSDRVTMIWDENVIQNQWLEVTVTAGGNLGLPGEEKFYFGNAIGESGNSPTAAKVNAVDVLLARNNPRNLTAAAAIDSRYDYNRDSRVNATDMLIARSNQTHLLSALQLIAVPAEAAKGEQPLPATPAEPDAAAVDWLYALETQNSPKRPGNKEDSVNDAVDNLFLAGCHPTPLTVFLAGVP